MAVAQSTDVATAYGNQKVSYMVAGSVEEIAISKQTSDNNQESLAESRFIHTSTLTRIPTTTPKLENTQGSRGGVIVTKSSNVTPIGELVNNEVPKTVYSNPKKLDQPITSLLINPDGLDTGEVNQGMINNEISLVQNSSRESTNGEHLTAMVDNQQALPINNITKIND